MRLSMDCKATVKIGDYSRGGRTRGDNQALDHDILPMLCVGETLDERKKGKVAAVLRRQQAGRQPAGGPATDDDDLLDG